MHSFKSQIETGLTPGNLPGGNLPSGELPPPPFNDVNLENELDIERLHEKKQKKRRDKMIQTVLTETRSLSQPVQDQVIKLYLSNGWGKMAHGIAQQLKAPGRYGLKLVDVALIMTVYDQTIAQVNSRAFAPISAGDFSEETGMDPSNIRIALNSLLARGVLLKNKTGVINFWALNPHYFSIKGKGDLPSGHSPGGKSPDGNTPCIKQGNLPGSEGGQLTSGQTCETTRNSKTISDVKNLFKESKKESSLGNGNFPADMVDRWMRFESNGFGTKVKNERVIFEKLFLLHGDSFFKNCGRVVAFLENYGNGKEGRDGTIHSPMVWIQNHWETNLNKYQNWLQKEDDLNKAHAKKLTNEAKTQVEAAEIERVRHLEDSNTILFQQKLELGKRHFFDAFPVLEEQNAFVQEALQINGSAYLQGCWSKLGWNSQLVKSCVIAHFLKVESGELKTQVQSKCAVREIA